MIFAINPKLTGALSADLEFYYNNSAKLYFATFGLVIVGIILLANGWSKHLAGENYNSDTLASISFGVMLSTPAVVLILRQTSLLLVRGLSGGKIEVNGQASDVLLRM